jgi:hypothetical protein
VHPRHGGGRLRRDASSTSARVPARSRRDCDCRTERQVVTTDTSRRAVALARVNTYRHGLSDRITVCHGDLLELVHGPI